MALALHISSVADAQAAILKLEEYILREFDLEDIAVLGLTVYTSDKLRAAGIGSVGQLARLSADELRKSADLGPKSCSEISMAIAKHRQQA